MLFSHFSDECVAVNGERFRAIIANYLVLQIKARGLAYIWFQHDDVPCPTMAVTIDLLRELFGDNGPVNCI